MPSRPAVVSNLIRLVVIGLVALLGSGFAALGLASAASAAVISIDQCNGVGPGSGGATTRMTCTVVVVNTISGSTQSSSVTVTRDCGNDPCAPGNGTFTTNSTNLVTSVAQCNGSDNDAAHPIICNVTITNNIRADAPQAQPVTAATVNQCVGSFTGGGGTNTCDPIPAATTGATVTQCNGSGNGGGGTVDCSVGSTSTVSRAIPIQINQCNGTGNPGGSVVRCHTSITTNIIAVRSASPTATPSATPSATATPAPTSSAGTPTSSGTPTAKGTGHGGSPAASGGVTPTGVAAAGTGGAGANSLSLSQQVARVPAGGVQAGADFGSQSRPVSSALVPLGAALVLCSLVAGVVLRRSSRRR